MHSFGAPALTTPSTTLAPGEVVCRSRAGARFFRNPVTILRADAPSDVPGVLESVEEATASGYTAAGFVAYEAAAAFDPAMSVHNESPVPFAWFGVYEEPDREAPFEPMGSYSLGPWNPLVLEAAYADALKRIREYIAAGHTYQVNYTFPLQASFRGDPYAWFEALYRAQPTDYAAYIQEEDFAVVSLSPELFFSRNGRDITLRPMKGTAKRGRWLEEDEACAEALRASEKDRAENVMIVDMVRNDIGRVSETGSVHVDALFDVERYPTLWQMTSTVSARTRATLPELFGALFPSASVTGAPKIRTMAIIRELEPYPRGVYCGAAGTCGPGGEVEFNVGIRTATVDLEKGIAQYHTGSGITWGSTAEGEYDECQLKSVLIRRPRPDFALLESMLAKQHEIPLLELHMDRLAVSAHYFDYSFDRAGITEALRAYAGTLSSDSWKLRVELGRNGAYQLEAVQAPGGGVLNVGFAQEPVDAADVFLFHKTTHRDVYERARASRPGCDDVILWNGDGELTESTFANIAVKLDGEWYTPPVACGLLAGVMRRRLIEEGTLHERVLDRSDLERAEDRYLINSVRGWIRINLIDV